MRAQIRNQNKQTNKQTKNNQMRAGAKKIETFKDFCAQISKTIEDSTHELCELWILRHARNVRHLHTAKYLLLLLFRQSGNSAMWLWLRLRW
jgi:hypothetical protein